MLDTLANALANVQDDYQEVELPDYFYSKTDLFKRQVKAFQADAQLRAYLYKQAGHNAQSIFN